MSLKSSILTCKCTVAAQSWAGELNAWHVKHFHTGSYSQRYTWRVYLKIWKMSNWKDTEMSRACFLSLVLSWILIYIIKLSSKKQNTLLRCIIIMLWIILFCQCYNVKCTLDWMMQFRKIKGTGCQKVSDITDGTGHRKQALTCSSVMCQEETKVTFFLVVSFQGINTALYSTLCSMQVQKLSLVPKNHLLHPVSTEQEFRSGLLQLPFITSDSVLLFCLFCFKHYRWSLDAG